MNAVELLRQWLPHARPRIALILGSGWSGLLDHVANPVQLPYAELPGFTQPGVAGHAGQLVVGRIGPHEVALLSGRSHSYESGRVDSMKAPLHTLRDWGCQILIQTNAAGSLRQNMPAGSLMLLQDHINFCQRSPLVGEAGSERFVNMVNAYDAELRRSALASAAAISRTLQQGTYLWCAGPQFETPAEIRMFASLGADAVGMSTVPETILARHAGLRVLAFSLITNMAAGLSDEPLSHSHTLAQAAAAGQAASPLLYRIICDLPA